METSSNAWPYQYNFLCYWTCCSDCQRAFRFYQYRLGYFYRSDAFYHRYARWAEQLGTRWPMPVRCVPSFDWANFNPSELNLLHFTSFKTLPKLLCKSVTDNWKNFTFTGPMYQTTDTNGLGQHGRFKGGPADYAKTAEGIIFNPLEYCPPRLLANFWPGSRVGVRRPRELLKSSKKSARKSTISARRGQILWIKRQCRIFKAANRALSATPWIDNLEPEKRSSHGFDLRHSFTVDTGHNGWLVQNGAST